MGNVEQEPFWLIRDGEGYEVEAEDDCGATTAAFALFQDGHPLPILILPMGEMPFGSYGRIG